jgi:4-hydroxyphenylpyruvate dioxygenase
MKTSNISFVEVAVKEPEKVISTLSAFGFYLKATHVEKKLFIMKSGSLYFILNCMATDHAIHSYNESGDSICGLGISGQRSITENSAALTLYENLYNAYAVIPFIGNCQFYLLDEESPLLENREWILNEEPKILRAHFTGFDHIAFAVNQGNLDYWMNYIEKKLPDLKCISNIEVEGHHSGMKTVAFVNSSNDIKIPIVEPKNSISQVQEFLNILKKEGVQHIAFETNNIVSTVEKIKKNKINFLKSPPNYYCLIEDRLNHLAYSIDKIMEHHILVDKLDEDKIIYQLFTAKQIGPIFFEFIERHNYEGFGEGNYKALFMSAEQICM